MDEQVDNGLSARPEDERLDSLIRDSGPASAEDGEIERVMGIVLEERARLLARRGAAWGVRRSRWIGGAAAAAAAAVFAIAIWIWHRPQPVETEPEGAPVVSDAGDGTRSEVVRVAPKPAIVELVEEAVAEVRGKSGPSARRAAERAARRLRAAGERAIGALVDAAGQDAAAGIAAMEILTAMRTPGAREAVVDIIENAAAAIDIDADVILRSIRNRTDLLSPTQLVELTRSERLGSWAILRLAERTPVLAARVFWRERRRREGGSFPFLRELVRELPAGPPADRGGPDPIRTFASRIALADRSDLVFLVEDLGRTGDRKAWFLLAAIFKTLGPDSAWLAACGRIGAVGAVPYLDRALGFLDGRGKAARDALAVIRSPDAVEALYAAWAGMRGPILPPERRDAFAQAIRGHGDVAVEVIARIARDGPAHRVAVEALVEIFPDRAGRVLVEVMEGSGVSLRAVIVGALGRLGDPAAGDALIILLGDPHLGRAARRSLRRIAGTDLGSDPGAWRDWWRLEMERTGQSANTMKWNGMEAT